MNVSGDWPVTGVGSSFLHLYSSWGNNDTECFFYFLMEGKGKEAPKKFLALSFS